MKYVQLVFSMAELLVERKSDSWKAKHAEVRIHIKTPPIPVSGKA